MPYPFKRKGTAQEKAIRYFKRMHITNIADLKKSIINTLEYSGDLIGVDIRVSENLVPLSSQTNRETITTVANEFRKLARMLEQMGDAFPPETETPPK